MTPASKIATPSLAEQAASGISIRELTIGFEAGPAVLDRLSLEISPGEILALVGPSGCGKSSLLRAVARLIVPRSGTIRFHSGLPNRRSGDLAYVFQDATLLPWRTVSENVALPLELGRVWLKSARRSRIQSALESVGLSMDAGEKFPRELSGGMRMRTSIARALVTDPNVLLLDEPFAALDDILRSRLNDLILELWNARCRTILFVTHNIAEAVYLSHRIAILGNGAVTKIIDNRLPLPRASVQRASIEFAELYGEVSQALSEVTAE